MTLVEGEPRLQNRAYLVNGSAILEGVYAKQHLVPFGEYVPLKKVLFFVHRLVEAAGDFVPGDDPSPLILGRQPFGVLICYEDIFPELARAAVERGATSLINITNDAWYGDEQCSLSTSRTGPMARHRISSSSDPGCQYRNKLYF